MRWTITHEIDPVVPETNPPFLSLWVKINGRYIHCGYHDDSEPGAYHAAEGIRRVYQTAHKTLELIGIPEPSPIPSNCDLCNEIYDALKDLKHETS